MATPQWIPVESSTLLKVRYNPSLKTMDAAFVSTAAKCYYVYQGVDASVFEQLLASESKGKFFNQFIKNKYEFEKVDFFVA